MDELFGRSIWRALKGDADCGGLLSYNFFSANRRRTDRRPADLRTQADDRFYPGKLSMRANLFASVAVLKIEMTILFTTKEVQVDRITGHGGLFKIPL